VDGILVSPGDIDELARSMTHLRNNPELRDLIAARAVRRSQEFSVEKVAAQIRSTWRQVLTRSSY
jgi:glycosyltransferase involved in cell wall biosynthesis